jgi:hypothetical protein
VSKKVSLISATKRKEEFVKVGSQDAVDTAIHLSVSTTIQLKKKATFNLNADLHQRLKVAAAVHRREMVDIVEEAVGRYLIDLEGNVGSTR